MTLMFLVHRYSLSSKVLMEDKSALVFPNPLQWKTGCCLSEDWICAVANTGIGRSIALSQLHHPGASCDSRVQMDPTNFYCGSDRESDFLDSSESGQESAYPSL